MLNIRSVGLALSVVLITAGCSTASGPEIVISNSGWKSVPGSVAAGGGSFTLTVTNETETQQEFVVVTLCNVDEVDYSPGNRDPGALPMRDGLLDLTRSGLCGDPENPDVALYWIVYPDYEAGEDNGAVQAPMTPGVVQPGEDTAVTIGGFKGGGQPGTYVIMSWHPDSYEADDYAVFTITD